MDWGAYSAPAWAASSRWTAGAW
ncbi:hypothetical protein [Kutzneria sp. NPDC052558]